jgi:hypothetical protein
MSQIIQSGTTNKPNAGALVIDFPTPFQSIPDVVVSPFWQNSLYGVGSPETITAITPFQFTVCSPNNALAGYFVTWVAVGC